MNDCCAMLMVLLAAVALGAQPTLATLHVGRGIQSGRDESSSSSSSSEQHRQQQQQEQLYARYEHYPDYCSTPAQMERRKVPPLRNATTERSDDVPNVGETRLVHVTAVIRHGARTPWSAGIRCWDGFWDTPATGVWDCNRTTVMAVPSRGPMSAQEEADGDGNNAAGLLLFEKRYDALAFPNDGLTNQLNGTCQVGQLLPRGYGQQLFNGNVLREAYTYRRGKYSHDERMRLLDVTVQDDGRPWHPDHLYFRADDDQRTVMSGHVLLRGLFGDELAHQQAVAGEAVVIPVHLADRDRDVLDANERDCPKLSAIRRAAEATPDYQRFNESEESKEIREYMAKEMSMGADSRNSLLDCLMCTICTDRPLHPAVDDYGGEGGNGSGWFSRLAEYDIQSYTKIMKHNQSEYARLALGPLWYEIMQNINPHLEGDEDGAVDAPKLALFSGHDTTIMPLLASIGPELWNDTDWASYASMMVIEIHELIDGQSDPEMYTSKFAFRLLYNGKILTPLVEGCHERCELCDIKFLKAKVDPIATRDGDCSVPSGFFPGGSSTSMNGNTEQSLVSLNTPAGTALFVGLVIMSAMLGCLTAHYCTGRRLVVHRKGGRKAVVNGGDWEIDYSAGDLELREGAFYDEPDGGIGVTGNGNRHY